MPEISRGSDSYAEGLASMGGWRGCVATGDRSETPRETLFRFGRKIPDPNLNVDDSDAGGTGRVSP
jgi:hypothetical protein